MPGFRGAHEAAGCLHSRGLLSADFRALQQRPRVGDQLPETIADRSAEIQTYGDFFSFPLFFFSEKEENASKGEYFFNFRRRFFFKGVFFCCSKDFYFLIKKI